MSAAPAAAAAAAAAAPPTNAESEVARYAQAKKDLIAALAKKRALDRQLAQLETHIYDVEGQYLLDTAVHSGGNIVHGFDGYLKNGAPKKRHEVADADRLFSGSSLTSAKALDAAADGDASGAEYALPATVLLAGGTRPPEISPAQAKKNRDREYQRRKRAQQSARVSETPGLSEDEGPRRKRGRYDD